MLGRVFCAALVGAFAIEPAFATSVSEGQSAYKDGKYEQSQRILRPLAQNGNAQAQFLLGRQYQLGQGVARNLVKAWVWYRRAEANGHTEAALFRHLLEKRKLISSSELTQARLLFGDPAPDGGKIARKATPNVTSLPRSRPKFASRRRVDDRSSAPAGATTGVRKPDAGRKPVNLSGKPKEQRRQVAAIPKKQEDEGLDDGDVPHYRIKPEPSYRPQSGTYRPTKPDGKATARSRSGTAATRPHRAYGNGGSGAGQNYVNPHASAVRPDRPAWSHEEWQARRWRRMQRWRHLRRMRRMQRWQRRHYGYYARPGWRRQRYGYGYYE